MEKRKVIVSIELQTSETVQTLKAVLRDALECDSTQVKQIQFNTIRPVKKGKK